MGWPEWIATGIGVTLGIIMGFALMALLILSRESLLEWIFEQLPGDRGADDLIRKTRDGGPAPVQVLVSDIHIDTWEYPPTPNLRASNFNLFLTQVRESESISTFVLNGDLMDIPENPGELPPAQQRRVLRVGASLPRDRGVLNSKYDPVLCNLAGLGSADRRFVYQVGNHDIGITGLRYIRDGLPQLFPQVQVSWNPMLVVEIDPTAEHRSEEHNATPITTSSIYLEHGQRYDPALALYIRTAVVDLLRGANEPSEEGFFEGMQRHGRRGPGRAAKRHAAWRKAAPSHIVEVPPDLTLSDPSANWDFGAQQLSFGQKFLRLRYRWAARRKFWALRRDGHMGIKAISMGHIHVPDRYVFSHGGVYINSGDWCGNATHQCYTVMYADGRVGGPYQWTTVPNSRV